MLKKTSAGLDTWTALGSNLLTSRERLDQILGRADTIAASVQEGKGTVGKLLTDSSVVNANRSMDELQVTSR